MNELARKEALRNAVKKRFGRKRKLKSKVITQYRTNLEREYIRITNAYMELLNSILKKYLPLIEEAANDELRQDSTYHMDAVNFFTFIRRLFSKAKEEFEFKEAQFPLRGRIEKLSYLTRKLSIREWKRVVNKTLGIDITEDYYMGEFFREQLKAWTNYNVDLIKSIPHDSLDEMRNVVEQGFMSGKTTKSIMEDIQDKYRVKKSKAKFLARDQMAKLNADIGKTQQIDAGVSEYIWRSAGDVRVRDRHRALDKKTFSWDNPPVVDVKTGRTAHPGEDYQCRCVALPIFDIEGFDMPLYKFLEKEEK